EGRERLTTAVVASGVPAVARLVRVPTAVRRRPVVTSSGAPGTVGETTFVVEILDAFPAKALNEPGAPAEIVVELHTTVPLDARLMAELQDRGDVIVTAERTVAAVRGTSRVVLTLNVPGDDARGYSVLVRDRKSTRLNSSHVKISYAVFCLKKKTHRNA